MLDFQADIEGCLAVLKSGGLILYPTDTVWGIGCDGTNSAAVERIYQLKERSEAKAMVVLVADQRSLLHHIASPSPLVFDWLDKITRPTTVIYDQAIGFADNLTAADGSIGIRVTGDAFCQHLIKRFKKPLVSTSANISGQPTPQNFSQIATPVLQGVDYVVHYRQDDLKPTQASMIVKWNRDDTVTIIRS